MTGTLRIRAIAVATAIAAVLVSTAVLDRWHAEVDLTADRTLSLTDTSLAVVRAVDAPVRITAFLPRAEAGRAEAAALLDRYQRANRRISYRLLDPDGAPGEMRRLGVDPALGGVAIQRGDRIERGPTVSEQDVTAGLARLVRDTETTICFTDRHGERPMAATGDGFAELARALTENGFEVTTTSAAGGLDRCSAAVVAAPQAAIDADDPLVPWLANGGRALVLTDPESSASVAPLLDPFGIRVERSIVLDENPNGHVPGDPATPVVAQYRSGFPFVRRLPPALFPGAQALSVAATPPEGVAVAAFATTTSGGVLRRPTGDSGATGDAVAEQRGRVTLAAAADRSLVEDGRVIRSRVVATGDVDLFSNAFLGELGHSRLALQAIEWLALQDDLVSVSANLPRARPLVLTSDRITYLRLLLAGVVPLAFLLAAAAMWTARRSR